MYTERDLTFWQNLLVDAKEVNMSKKLQRDCYIKIVAIKKELNMRGTEK